MTILRFPDGFGWGAATSAFQVEGAVREDGRGASIWDTFTRQPGRIANGDTADVTSDHYHRWRDDVALMAELGLREYRGSVGWPRVLPTGRAPVNPAGLAFYDRLVDALLAAGVAPAFTLYHWDLPQALEDEGGWLERRTAHDFAAFARICFDALGDRVATWYTINEPWVVATLGYRLGLHAPGRRDLAAAFRVSHHLLLAHGLAVQAFRASGATGRIGIAPNLLPTVPASDDPADAAAAIGSDGYTNRWFLDPVFRGRYPDDTRELVERLTGRLDAERAEDAATIASPIDVLGVNYYARRVVRAGDGDTFPWTVVPGPPDVPRTDAGWEIVPASLTDVLLRVQRDYGDVPLRITENGAVFLDRPGPDGRIRDAGRQRFLRDHLVALHAAIEAGVRVEAYDHWSLLDNFEWADGYRPRYGLIDVDYPTGRRLIKDSGRFYAAIIAAGGVDADDEPWAPEAGAGTMRGSTATRTTAGAPEAG
jgi:beta-glucosidase